MSKSLGNFITVHELLQQLDPQVLRFFMAATQYRRPIQYSEANLQDAHNNLQHLQTAAQNLNFRLQDHDFGDFDAAVQSKQEAIKENFISHMDDDFNVQNGLSDLYELMRLINQYSAQKQVNQQNIHNLLIQYTDILRIFGIEFATNPQLDQQIEALIQQRDTARAQKDFATSDDLRSQLLQMGIILEDTPQGTRWHKK